MEALKNSYTLVLLSMCKDMAMMIDKLKTENEMLNDKILGLKTDLEEARCEIPDPEYTERVKKISDGFNKAWDRINDIREIIKNHIICSESTSRDFYFKLDIDTEFDSKSFDRLMELLDIDKEELGN